MKSFFKLSTLAAILIVSASCNQQAEIIKSDLRAPGYPLVSIDPYTSAWSLADKLYDESVKHWTGAKFPLIGAIRVDGKVYRFMGTEDARMTYTAKMAETGSWTGRYSFVKPRDGWQKPEFDDSKWQAGAAAFGSPEETAVKTVWQGEEIWIRREIMLDEDLTGKPVFLDYSCDDGAELYINGINVFYTQYEHFLHLNIPHITRAF